MSMLVWVMMGIAIWHFTVFVPDRFWGGIVGAFLVAIARRRRSSASSSPGFTVPGQNDTDIEQALIAVPGALLALGALVAVRVAPRARAQPSAERAAAFHPSCAAEHRMDARLPRSLEL